VTGQEMPAMARVGGVRVAQSGEQPTAVVLGVQVHTADMELGFPRRRVPNQGRTVEDGIAGGVPIRG
jgi:hypothetical protein